MERYTVSRELAEKLKDAGYPNNTMRAWYKDTSSLELVDWSREAALSFVWPAPMSDELLEQLPAMIENGTDEFYLTIEKVSTNDLIVKYTNGEQILYGSPHGETLAEALAGLWLLKAEAKGEDSDANT